MTALKLLQCACLVILCCSGVYKLALAGDFKNAQEPQSQNKISNGGDFALKQLIKILNSSYSRSLVVEKALCLGRGQVYIPPPRQFGLVGYWSFDYVDPLDESGNSNHIIGSLAAGPPCNGHGASAIFTPGNFRRINVACSADVGVKIAYSDSLTLDAFTVDFRIYLLQDYGYDFRNVLSRNNIYSQAPAIYIYPTSNKLSIRVSSEASIWQGFSSNSKVPSRRWTQVTLIGRDNWLKLYINGKLDAFVKLDSRLSQSSGDLILGKKYHMDGFEGYMDDLRIYNVALEAVHVPMLVAPNLTGFTSAFGVQLGSTCCSSNEATAKGFCPAGCSLCSLDHIYRNGAHTARINGWLYYSNKIWHKGVDPGGECRVALCCCD